MPDLFENKNYTFTQFRNFLSSLLAYMTVASDKSKYYGIAQYVPFVCQAYLCPMTKFQPKIMTNENEDLRNTRETLAKHWFLNSSVVVLQPPSKLFTQNMDLQKKLCQYITEMHNGFIKGDFVKLTLLKKKASSLLNMSLMKVFQAKYTAAKLQLQRLQLAGYLMWMMCVFLKSAFEEQKSPIINLVVLYFENCAHYYYDCVNGRAVLKEMTIPCLPNTHILGFYEQTKIQLSKIEFKLPKVKSVVKIEKQISRRKQEVLYLQMLLQAQQFNYDENCMQKDIQYLEQRSKNQQILVPPQIAAMKSLQIQSQIAKCLKSIEMQHTVQKIVAKQQSNRPVMLKIQEFIKKAKQVLPVEQQQKLDKIAQIQKFAKDQQMIVALFEDDINEKFNYQVIKNKQIVDTTPIELGQIDEIDIQKYHSVVRGNNFDDWCRNFVALFLEKQVNKQYISDLKKYISEKKSSSSKQKSDDILAESVLPLITQIRRWYIEILKKMKAKLHKSFQEQKRNKFQNNLNTVNFDMTRADYQRSVCQIKDIFTVYFKLCLSIRSNYINQQQVLSYVPRNQMQEEKNYQTELLHRIQDLEDDQIRKIFQQMLRKRHSFSEIQQNQNQQYFQDSFDSEGISSYQQDSEQFQDQVHQGGKLQLDEIQRQIEEIIHQQDKKAKQNQLKDMHATAISNLLGYFQQVLKKLENLIDHFAWQQRSNPGLFQHWKINKIQKKLDQLRSLSGNLQKTSTFTELGFIQNDIDKLFQQGTHTIGEQYQFKKDQFDIQLRRLLEISDYNMSEL